MAVDASIYQGVQPVQQANPLAALAQAYQLRGMQSQIDKADRETAQQQGIADAYKGALGADGTIDRNKLLSSVVGAGQGAAVPGIQKGFADQDKASRDAEKAKYEAMLQQFDVAGRIMSGVTDQASWDRARAQTAQVFGPEKAAQMPAEYNPALIAENQQKAMAVKDQVEQRYKALTFAETQRHNIATEGTAAGNLGVAQGNLAVNQGQLTVAQQRAQQQARDAALGRVPSGYRLAADGQTLEFIPGGPADPSAAKKAAPTEFQGKSAGFGARAQESDRILNEIAGDYSPAGINTKNSLGGTPLIGGALEAGANAMLSDKSQMAEQAQRDFMNALLRQESGAAIGKDEFNNGKRQYFPQPGDSDAVIAQKAANRRLAVQGLLNNAGNATVATPQPTAQPKPAAGVLNVTNAADYAKVPSGATYQTPDGKMRRKP